MVIRDIRQQQNPHKREQLIKHMISHQPDSIKNRDKE